MRLKLSPTGGQGEEGCDGEGDAVNGGRPANSPKQFAGKSF